MPTYEYHCEKCKKDFEFFQSMKDDPITTCPKEHCRQKTWGKGKVRRLLGTGAGLIFKGSGFYTTDYRSEGYKQAAKKESSGETAKPAESKPDTASKAPPAKSPPATEPRKQKKKE
jgi:putative FmdB family regulatory protein